MTRRKPVDSPDLQIERSLLRDGRRYLAGLDEVGRGALAGPVSVGAVVVSEDTGQAPIGLQDSKKLTASARAALCQPLRLWAVDWAVGHAWPTEIDAFGISAGLHIAANRALAALRVSPDVVLLDGNTDFVSDASSAAVRLAGTLFSAESTVSPSDFSGSSSTEPDAESPAAAPAGRLSAVPGTRGSGSAAGLTEAAGAAASAVRADIAAPPTAENAAQLTGAGGMATLTPSAHATLNNVIDDVLLPGSAPTGLVADGTVADADTGGYVVPIAAGTVHLRTRADVTCAAVAAASVLAKTTRDALLASYDELFTQYGFAQHKGYGTAAHRAALEKYGPCELHRTSWRLPGGAAVRLLREDGECGATTRGAG